MKLSSPIKDIIMDTKKRLLSLNQEQPNNTEILLDLARLYRQENVFDKCIEYYERLLRLSHAEADIWLEYAESCILAEKFTEALNLLHNGKLHLNETLSKPKFRAFCEKCVNLEDQISIKLNPDGDIIKTLTDNYNLKNNPYENIDECTKLVKIYPNSYILHNLIGALYNSIKKTSSAALAYKRALDIYPNFAPSLINLANLYTKTGHTEKAYALYHKSLQISPNNFDAVNNFGILLVKTNPKKAISLLELAVNIQPNSFSAWNSLGTAYHAIQSNEEALRCYQTALKYNKNYADCLNNIGVLLSNQGKFKQANKYYQRAIDADPTLTSAFRHLAMNKAIGSHVAPLNELYKKISTLDVSDRANVCFALALVNEEEHNYSMTVKLLIEGGGYRREELRYKFEDESRVFETIHKTSKSLPAPISCVSSPETVPVFITGMPRSGTSLVEQIISSHSIVGGLGELGFVNQICHKMFHKGFITETDLQIFRNEYLLRIRQLNSTELFLTDKMPQNFLYLGLIARAFPEAKLINVQRNGAAVCWSNFKQYFASNSMGYSYDLDDTITYFQMYQKLMEHWTNDTKTVFYNLKYEKLVEHSDIEIERLLEFIGLETEEACFSPHMNPRNVATASQRQVRQKIYKGSSHAWEKFKPYMSARFLESFT